MRERTKKLTKTQLALFDRLPEMFYLEELVMAEISPTFVIDADTNEVVFGFEGDDWNYFNTLWRTEKMKLKDMKVGLKYVATTGGSTIKKGDHLKILSDGCILCNESAGWITKDEWKRLRNEVALDLDGYNHAKELLQQEINRIDYIIKSGSLP